MGKELKDDLEKTAGEEYKDCTYINSNVQCFIASLVDKYEEEKRFKRLCKTKTLFRIKDDKKESFRAIDQPYDQKIKKCITIRYGLKLIEIINERYL